MPTIEFVTALFAPQEALWRFHATLDVLPRITPPGTRIRLPSPRPELREGARFTMVVSAPPLFFPLAWETVITVFEPPHRFVDEQGRGPFARWRHEHRFEPIDEGRTRLCDLIDYELPLGPLGRLIDALIVRRQIEAAFAFRHAATKRLLEAAEK